MIGLLTQDKAFKKELQTHLSDSDVSLKSIGQNGTTGTELSNKNLSAVIFDLRDTQVWGQYTHDLNVLSNRIPVIAVSFDGTGHDELDETITIVEGSEIDGLYKTLEACRVLDANNNPKTKKSVAFYNPHVPKRMLDNNGAIAVLTIDGSQFRKIEVEYGYDVYDSTRRVLQNILVEILGSSGGLRGAEVLCRNTAKSNTYYVFLERARTTGCLPLPGMLEQIADRMRRSIQDALWEDLTAGKDRRIPSCIQNLPNVVVGYSGTLANPCLDSGELVHRALESAMKNLRIQATRLKDRQKETMQTLIQAPDLLMPFYQAVFHLPKLTKDKLEEVKKSDSIAPVCDNLYGFESLVRVRKENLLKYIGEERLVINPRLLTPDVLFSVAKATNVALELDQACLKLATKHSDGLPGVLMINILPRNLYFIDYLKELFASDRQVMLEVSESENINNFHLVNEALQGLSKNQIQFAADDFGKGYAGLDRVIKMRPALIKFDRSLIQDIHKDSVKKAYVGGLVQAARLLKETRVLAEGVELWEEAETLQAMGVDLIQGYLLHRPQPVQEIISQLENASKPESAAA